TSLCIVRNTPKMIADMRSWRSNVRENSLRNFHHRHEWKSSRPVKEAVAAITQRLAAHGFKTKTFDKDGGTLIAGRAGAASKWGYIFAHSAIVIICIGGLLDSDLPIRFQEWFQGKTPFSGNGVLISEIPAKHRLSVGNPTFRANTLIPEGASSSTAMIPRGEGVLIQELPFGLELKRFIIEYYSTGMPKLFASEVMVIDGEKKFPATIKVNQPLIYKSVAVYQSSFEDGGSKLKVDAYPMAGSNNYSFELSGNVGSSTPLTNSSGSEYTVEWSGFRAINVENTAQNGQDVRAVNLGSLDKHLGSAAKNANNKDLKNVGPSVQYKLRDKTGQAREFHNYMQPVLIDGAYVFLAGIRASPNESFRYLRIPADEADSVVEWMRLRAALLNPELRSVAAKRYAQRAMPKLADERLKEQLEQSALKGLTVFAGDSNQSGYIAVSRFLESVPPAEQEKAADIFMKILNGSLWDLWQVAREKENLPLLPADEKHGRFLQLAMNAYSDSFFYGAPVYLKLRGFEEVKASVFQVTRSPGKNVVYLGCLLLVLGIFAMFYVRERRVWIWLKPDEGKGVHALMAMSAPRKTLDFDKEFDVLKTGLAQA
ncbi:MAG: cytochrome C-type biosis transrane protein, partial [Paucimonas sp.]|nr:cytochrome C-type biosis transrane protein [Paucimonas sp.]